HLPPPGRHSVPTRRSSDLSFAGLVSQETGEDWSDARLTLSTAVPATSTQMPKIFSWKIGELERFIPTPAPMAEYVKPAPQSELLDRKSTRLNSSHGSISYA